MLTHEQISGLKIELEKAKLSIDEEIKNLHAETPPSMGGDVDHFEEEADQAEEFTTNVSIANALKERAENIDLALSKIAKGAYGTCEKCGMEIEFDVLSVDPESRLCKQCKLNG